MTDVVENPSEAVTWQGKLTPDSPGRHNAEEDTGRGIKLHSAGRRLLAELVRPYRRPIIGVLLIVVAQVAATMAAPWLIGVAIDNSLPAAMRGDYTSLTVVGSALLVAALLPAGCARPSSCAAAPSGSGSSTTCGNAATTTCKRCRWPSTSGSRQAG